MYISDFLEGPLRAAKPCLILFHVNEQYIWHSLEASQNFPQFCYSLRSFSPGFCSENVHYLGRFWVCVCIMVMLVAPFHFLLLLPFQSSLCVMPTAFGGLDPLSHPPAFTQFPFTWLHGCGY